MKNLRNIRHDVWRATEEVEDLGTWPCRDITAVCWDAAKNEVLATVGPHNEAGKIELLRLSSDNSSSKDNTSGPFRSVSISQWDSPSPNPDLAVDRVVSLHHFGDNLTTCLVLAGGDIVTVQEEDFAQDPARVEIVGSIDAGISAARWSPDEELLLITTNDNNVVFMSRTFDGITEATMTAEDLKASKHVSVGWGKKETQFQGRGAKAKDRAIRDPTIPEKVDEGELSPHDDGRTTISWRGDGAYVAVNSVEAGHRRVIRVYSREGVLDSVSEPVDGLEGSLSWRPAGNLMAGIQRFSDRVDIVFFERNGLRHGQFTLRVPQDTVSATEDIALEWNSDSTVLAVLLKDRIQLWTTGNYHWYLKQEIFTGSSRPHFAWDPEEPLRYVAAQSTTLYVQEYAFSTARGSLTPPHDYGAVAVIDGQTLKVTPIRTANIPPPMAMFELDAESSIIDVAFAQDNSALAVLHHKGVDWYTWETKEARSLVPRLVGKGSFPVTEHDLSEKMPLQVTISAQDAQVLIHSLGKDGTQKFTIGSHASNSYGSWTETDVGPGVSSLVVYKDSQTAVLTRRCQIRDLSQQQIFADFQVSGTPPPSVDIVEYDGETLAFGLLKNGHLLVNSERLVKNCTSYLVTPSHLIFTTSNHLLKFVHLDHQSNLQVPADDPEIDERCRSIERGARLVTAVPTNMSLVLQMPRGNLETIFPRAMVLAGIRQLIDEKRYDKAFATCRTQRVDMNILCDYQPELFLQNVGLFLDQLQDVTYIDLFLSSLKEEDVAQTMYKDTRPSKKEELPSFGVDGAVLVPPPAAESTTGSKVNRICDAVLKALQNSKNASLQNIITAHVCKNPPALDDALRVVADLMTGEDETVAERAVEHICFLVDVNKLYDHALGLYNLELALLVAQQSQRDPREYLPFIQNLHQLEPVRRQFAIDDHLGRREKALGHLKTLNVFDEVTKYTAKYNLYQTALNLYRYDGTSHRTLTELYASYLESTSKFREAGLAYESVQNYTKATSCYSSAGATSWRECLFAASQQTPALSEAQVSELATNLADALYEAKDYASAATIHAEHLASIETAVRYLCKGYLFADAMRLSILRNRADLLTSTVDTGLADCLSSTTEFLADCKSQLKAQVPRILELRRKAIEDPLAFYEGEYGRAGQDIPDDVSIAASSRVSTSASLFTRYTGKAGSVGTLGSNASRATSKNRKREEKKRARGRKGTVYEEEYLVNSVRRLVERVQKEREDIERLVFGLVRRGMAERARAVEGLVAEVVEGCRVAVGQVWPEQGGDGVGGGEGEGEGEQGRFEETYRPLGAEAVLRESLEARNVRQEPPVVAQFAKLSLLG